MDGAPLAKKRCVTCHGGTPRLTDEEVAALLGQVPEWRVAEERRLTRTFKFKDFAGPVAFATRVAAVAEAEDHHPDLHVYWGRLEVDITTHAIRGLSENDFILAAKIDQL